MDNGKSWEEPRLLTDWCREGGIVQLPSGELLALLRWLATSVMPLPEEALVVVA